MNYPPEVQSALTRLPAYNSSAVSPENPYGEALGGHRANFPAALRDFTTVARAIPAAASASETASTAAEASAASAASAAATASAKAAEARTSAGIAAAAADAAAQAHGTFGASATALLLGPGVKSLVTQPGLAWVPGMSLALSAREDPAGTRMGGLVLGYDKASGALEVVIDAMDVTGRGFCADWLIGPSGRRGARGIDGSGSAILVQLNGLASPAPRSVLDFSGDGVAVRDDPETGTAHIAFRAPLSFTKARYLTMTQIV